MGQRKEALWRVIALVWQGVIGFFAGSAIALVAVVWMVFDVIWQFLTGRDGLSAMSTPAEWVSRTLEWIAGQLIYAFTGGGDGEFRAIP